MRFVLAEGPSRTVRYRTGTRTVPYAVSAGSGRGEGRSRQLCPTVGKREFQCASKLVHGHGLNINSEIASRIKLSSGRTSALTFDSNSVSHHTCLQQSVALARQPFSCSSSETGRRKGLLAGERIR